MRFSLEKKLTLSSILALALLLLSTVISLLVVNDLMHLASEATVSLKQIEQRLIYIRTVMVTGILLAALTLLLAFLKIKKDVQNGRVVEKSIHENEKWLDDAQQLTSMDSWEYSVSSKQLVLSEPLYELWQIAKDAMRSNDFDVPFLVLRDPEFVLL